MGAFHLECEVLRKCKLSQVGEIKDLLCVSEPDDNLRHKELRREARPPDRHLSANEQPVESVTGVRLQLFPSSRVRGQQHAKSGRCTSQPGVVKA